MFPYCASTLRENERASAGSASPFSTASRIERPPGCTAQRSIASGSRPARHLAAQLLQRTANLARNLPGKVHVETQFPDAPRNQVARLRNVYREKAVDCQTLRLRAHHRCCASIRENQKRQHLLQLRRLLKMQRAELQIQQQHTRLGLRANNVVRRLQRIDGRIAAHEADHGPLHRRVQSEMIHHFKIKSRRIEPGARSHDHMRHRAPFVF